jgi:TonB family protein
VIVRIDERTTGRVIRKSMNDRWTSVRFDLPSLPTLPIPGGVGLFNRSANESARVFALVQGAVDELVPSLPEAISGLRIEEVSSQPGSPAPRLASPASSADDYVARIRRHLAGHWRPPLDAPAGKKVVVIVELSGDGKVNTVELEESSGSDDFDRAAERAIRAADPFPQRDAANQAVRVRLRFRTEG